MSDELKNKEFDFRTSVHGQQAVESLRAEAEFQKKLEDAFREKATKFQLRNRDFYAINRIDERKLYHGTADMLSVGDRLLETTTGKYAIVASVGTWLHQETVKIDGKDYNYTCRVVDYKYDTDTLSEHVSISKLEELESDLYNAKTTLFNKKSKEQAMELFPQFKKNVLNNRYDEYNFERILKAFGGVSAELKTNAKKIIDSIEKKY